LNTDNEKVYLFGAGQIGEAIRDFIVYENLMSFGGFVVHSSHMTEEYQSRSDVFSIEQLAPGSQVFVALGYNKMNDVRADVFLEMQNRGMKSVSLVSRKANISGSCQYGKNVLIMEHNNIQSSVQIDDNTLLWSGNHVGHHSKLGRNVFMSSHCVVSGNTTIGQNTFMGVNSSIADNVKIGDYNLIDMSAIVKNDTENFTYVKSIASDCISLSEKKLKRLM